jgi:diguanylate cyclase (GGDEF)-like protein
MSAREAVPVLERCLPRLFPAAAGAVYFCAGTNDELRRECAWGGTQAAEVVLSSDCWSLRRGKAYLSEARDPRCPHVSKDFSGATICVPLVAHGESVGLLCLEYAEYEPQAAIRAQRANSAAAVAWHIGLALSNLRLRESLREQSLEDSLTGLSNRRYLNTTLPREIGRARRLGAAIAIFMLDIDHFKRFNDSQGHAGGDAVLTALGALLQESCRQGDLACRYGGEEFTVLLFGADGFMARDWAQRLTSSIRALEVRLNGVILPPFTLSMGLALYPAHGADAATLLQAADRALYEAKRAGRDRLVICGGDANATVPGRRLAAIPETIGADVIELKVPSHKKP